MDEQTKGNQYTYDGRTERQGQSIYIQWNNRQTRAINIPTMDEDRQEQSIYLRWTNRQNRAINIFIMTEERQGQSIYLRWTKANKGNQYTYD
jgi:hypothetical protein